MVGIRAVRPRFVIILGLLILLFSISEVFALDPPHDSSRTLTCSSCHFSAGSNPLWYNSGASNTLIDDTPMNRLCWSCHDDSTAPYVDTHSSYAMNDNSYGNWNRECRACHDPHQQKQLRKWGLSQAQLFTPTPSTGIQINYPVAGQSQLTKTGAGWTD